MQHLPGFVQKADVKGEGVDAIACTAVNDAFVMGAWAKDQGADDVITMIADGNGDLAKTLGLEMDVSVAGLGMRSQRYAMVVDNGTVTKLFVEEPRAFEVSSAEHVGKYVTTESPPDGVARFVTEAFSGETLQDAR